MLMRLQYELEDIQSSPFSEAGVSLHSARGLAEFHWAPDLVEDIFKLYKL